MKCPYCEWPIDPENKIHEMGSECICDVKNEPWVVKIRAYARKKIRLMTGDDGWFSFDDEWDVNVHKSEARILAAAYPVKEGHTRGDVWIPLLNRHI